MSTEGVVYRKLTTRISLMGLSRREVAQRLGICYGTFRNKLCAVTPFTLDEAIRLKQILAFHGPLEEVFETSHAKEPKHANI